MNKKIAKIIFTIIFVFFFKLGIVNASDDKNYSCTYSDHTGSVFEGSIKVDVKDGSVSKARYSKTTHFDKSAYYVAIKDKKQFDGLKDKETGCPSNIYVITNASVTNNVLYFNHIPYDIEVHRLREITGFFEFKKYSSMDLDSTTYKPKTAKSGGNANCTCLNSNDKSISFVFKVINYDLNNATLNVPNGVFGLKDVVDKNNYIQNFNSNATIYLGPIAGTKKINYNYSSNELKKDKCPPYTIASKKSYGVALDYNIYFSDESHKNDFISAINEQGITGATPIVLNCSPTTYSGNEPDPDPVPEEPEEKHYDDPDVVMNVVPLNYSLDTYSCGNGYLESIPVTIPLIGKIVYLLVQILVPIILILLGSFDLVKAVVSQKDDDIKKNQQIFIKRLISAALLFFVFAIVKMVISVVSSSNSTDIMDCVDCIIRNNSNCKRE